MVICCSPLRLLREGSRRKKVTACLLLFAVFTIFWLHSITVTSPVLHASVSPTANGNERYIIYYCRDLCGGWADRLKGIVIAYVFANLTNRRFGIQIPSMPCNLTSFLEPNEVQWNFSLSSRDMADSKMYSKMKQVSFYDSIDQVDLDTVFKSRVALFKSNLDYFDKLKQNQRYQSQLAWMQPLTRDQIFAKIYRALFRLSPAVQREVDRALLKAKPVQRGQLICAHFRMAANAENFRDTVARHTEKHGETVLNFLRQFDETDADNPDVKQKAVEADTVIGPSDTLDKNTNGEEANKGDSLRTETGAPSNSSSSNSSAVRFFVTSDSAKYMRKAEELFGNRFIRTEGRFVHVDHTGRNSQMACDGFTKLLVDQELLVRCDVLVISMSGFGRQAAARRGTSKGLYCILMNGTLVKCSPDQLKELYHIRG